LLPIIEALIRIIIEKVVPGFEKFAKLFDPIRKAVDDNKESFQALGSFIVDYIVPVFTVALGGAISFVAKIAAGVVDIVGGVINVIRSLVSGAIDGINALIKAYNAIPILPNIPTISKPTLAAPSVSSSSVSVPNVPTVASPTISTPNISGASSGLASASSSAAKATSYATPTMTYDPLTGKASTTAYNPLSGMTTIAPTINIGVAGDPEGVARTVVDVLNRSYARGALGAELLSL
jgi:phage-related protein